ncbi:hypothetical protein CP533_3836 [Ophiocordyceps camponoti-saundersi (nom. inval.)]|nr:hypothetical protein CP533_3836 [Ophiocordyceps camponoti-saundersi (nom. inval.)]
MMVVYINFAGCHRIQLMERGQEQEQQGRATNPMPRINLQDIELEPVALSKTLQLRSNTGPRVAAEGFMLAVAVSQFSNVKLPVKASAMYHRDP